MSLDDEEEDAVKNWGIQSQIDQNFSFRNLVFDDLDLSLNHAYYKKDLEGSSFRNTELIGSFLAEANLKNVDFTGADLREANLRASDCRGANFTDAKMEKMSVSEYTLVDARTKSSLTQEQLDSVYFAPSNGEKYGHLEGTGWPDFCFSDST